MNYQLYKWAKEETKKFFRNKYGFFWKRKINPKRKSLIMVDEYFNKFKEFANQEESE